MNFGMNVIITHKQFGTITLDNVTEIHYIYNHIGTEAPRIAFESDIHGTGNTYEVADLLEFEAKTTDVEAEHF